MKWKGRNGLLGGAMAPSGKGAIRCGSFAGRRLRIWFEIKGGFPIDLHRSPTTIMQVVELLKIDVAHPQAELLEKARQTLAEGGLVIVPTETVYGIACNPAVPGALEKLVAAKGRDGDKPIARLAASAGQVEKVSKDWNPGLQALAAKYWPGSLTIVLETSKGWTGFRVPAHAVALALAETCECTLALTSANLSGEPDTTTAQEAMASIDADLVIDSGPSAKTALPSTVVKVDGARIECLREGVLPFGEVKLVFKKGLS